MPKLQMNFFAKIQKGAKNKNFLILPKELKNKKNPIFKGLTTNDRILYAELRNNYITNLKYDNNIDDNGNHYIEYPISKAMEELSFARQTIVSGLHRLREIGLIKRIEEGTGQIPDKYIVLDCSIIQNVENSKIEQIEPTTKESLSGLKNDTSEYQKLDHKTTYYNKVYKNTKELCIEEEPLTPQKKENI